jgi:ATP-dependent helicase HrpB
MSPDSLPIHELRDAFRETLTSHSRVILQAPTGSGKSTQIPQFILDDHLAGTGEILVLQPRRLPTRMLAQRVASERRQHLGDEVGYQIRMDRVASERTRIRFITEGILLRMMLSDPFLEGVGCIVFDEFHERHLHGDISLARAVALQDDLRPDLKLVVMSATLDTKTLENYLAPCRVLQSDGRMFPVDIRYLSSTRAEVPIWDMAARAFEEYAGSQSGDVLVFMPGSYEINRTIEALSHSSAAKGCVILPLHGELPPDIQDAAVNPNARRKIIVSTNVAETSLTIDGVRWVIDSGLARIARFDPYRGINTLYVEQISRAASDQRAGRAGRTAAGTCIRLWTERDHDQRAPRELPEIRRLDLAEVLLNLKAAGFNDPSTFRWIEPPDPKALDNAVRLLSDLAALESDGSLSETGRRMLPFPVHPRYAKLLLTAADLSCVPDAAAIAALTQGRPLLQRGLPRDVERLRDSTLGEETQSDLLYQLRALRFAEQHRFDISTLRPLGIHAGAAREASALAKQFLQLASNEGLSTGKTTNSTQSIPRCLLAAFPDQVGIRNDPNIRRCHLVHNRRGTLSKESSVEPTGLFIASEIRETETRAADREVLLGMVTLIEEEWLREMFPGHLMETTQALFDSTQRRVIARRETRFIDLTLRSKDSDAVPENEAARLLAIEVESGRCVMKAWDDAVEAWIQRVNLAADQFPEWQIPAITPEDRTALIEQICFGATSYREIKERDVWPTLRTWLSAAQNHTMEQLFPERLEMPNGRKFKIQYSGPNTPSVAVRIQDLFGVKGELRIANNRIPLVIQVLAPSQRPIQITRDLTTFWRESYPKIRAELSRKYPKHDWRENPLG